MPTVPTYDGPHLRQAAAEGAYQTVQDVSSGRMAVAKSFDALGETFDKAAEQQATVEAQGAELALRQKWYAADAQLRKQYSGTQIEGYGPAVADWWKTAPQEHGKDLSPRAQRIASRSLMGAQEMAQRTSAHYAATEREAASKQAALQGIALEVNSAVADTNKTGSPANTVVYVANIQAKNAEQAKLNNWTPETLALKNLNDTTATHLSVIQALKTSRPDEAMAYFDYVKGDATQFDPKKVDDVAQALKPLADAQAGFVTVNAMWDTLGPTSRSEPVDTFAFSKAIDAKYPDDPAKRTAAKQALAEKTSAWNASQNQFKAASTNEFFKNIDEGKMPVSKALALAVSNGMPREEAHNLQHRLTLEATARDGRDVQAMQRAEMKLRLMGGPVYLEKSNPAVLSGMSRDEVLALRSVVGVSQTEQLLGRWDSLNTKEGKATAKMSQETFNMVAEEMQLNPYAPGKSQDDKAKLGTLKGRMDLLADQMAKENPNRPVTQEALAERMRKEMATEITTKGFIYGTNTQPVITMKAEDVARVVVPAEEKAALIAKLRAGYAANPIPAYEPTEDNLKRLYMRQKSDTARMIPNAK